MMAKVEEVKEKPTLYVTLNEVAKYVLVTRFSQLLYLDKVSFSFMSPPTVNIYAKVKQGNTVTCELSIQEFMQAYLEMAGEHPDHKVTLMHPVETPKKKWWGGV